MALKVKGFDSRAYLDYVKSLPCCHCRRPGRDPHHLMVKGASGMGMTAPDIAVVPLCRICHTMIQPHAKDYPQLKWLIETLNRALIDGVLVVMAKPIKPT